MVIFVNTIIINVILILALIINTTITYKKYKKNRLFPYGYSDYAILVEAFKYEIIKIKFQASILIPLAILIDLILFL